jgi:hypothetical protein
VALMKDRFDTKWQALIDALRQDGQFSATETRQAVFAQRWAEVSGPVRSLLEKIAGDAYKVTDEDVAAVEASEDETFELMVCTAAGVADRTLRAGLRALDRATPCEATASNPVVPEKPR